MHFFWDACKCMVRCFALRSGAGESGCIFRTRASAWSPVVHFCLDCSSSWLELPDSFIQFGGRIDMTQLLELHRVHCCNHCSALTRTHWFEEPPITCHARYVTDEGHCRGFMRDLRSKKNFGGGATSSKQIVMFLPVCPRCGGSGPMTRPCCGTERLLVGIPEDNNKNVLAAMRRRVLMRRVVRALVLHKIAASQRRGLGQISRAPW